MKMYPVLASLLSVAVLSACGSPTESEFVSRLDVPASPGSMGPNLATGPYGDIVLSWIEPADDGHALRFSVFEGDGWQAPRTVAGGSNWFVNWADFPSVVPLSDSLWGAHWLASQPTGGYAYDILASISTDSGDTWGEPFIPHKDNTPTEHGFVSLFPDSNGLGMLWLDGRKMVNDYDDRDIAASGMTLRAGTFHLGGSGNGAVLVDDLTCDCCQTDVAVTAAGPVAAYRDRTAEEVRDIYVSRRVNGEWQPGERVAADNWNIAACPVNGPVIAARGDTVAVAWFTAAAGKPVVKVAWSRDAAQTFAAPVQVDVAGPLGHVGGVLLPNDDFVVSWLRKSGGGGASLLLQRVSPTGSAVKTMTLDVASDVFAFSVPQLVLMQDSVIAAWTAERDKQYFVESASIPLSLLANTAQ